MKKLILFGAGEVGLKWLNKLGNDNVYALADFNSQKVGKYIKGKKVLSIEDLGKLNDEKIIYISTSSKYREEIHNLLEEFGLQEYIVDTPYWETGNYIDVDAYVDDKSILEGKNSILKETKVIESYVGYASYIAVQSEIIKTRIGRYCSIASDVKIIRGQHPTKKFVSIYPGFYSSDNPVVRASFVEDNLFEEYRYADFPYAVTIGNDVWIGIGVSIMEGVKIADGTIVAAGAMVIKDTEPYTIVGGIPAKIIGERFSSQEKDFLLKLKWWDKSEKWIREYASYFNDIGELRRVVSE